jgi:hypothetical protein
MNPMHIPDVSVSRRHWIALAVASLAGCGGGDSTVAGDPGTGGTGIYSSGKIAGFGSVIVNGIRFDDSSAAIWLDGDRLPDSSTLRLGMVAGVAGMRNSDQVSGTANSIRIWSVAQGCVTTVTPLAGGGVSFALMGMTIDAGPSAVFGDGLVAAGITSGMRLKVWGLQADATGRQWAATRVEPDQAGSSVTTGLVVLMGAQRYVNGIKLLGRRADALLKGQLVRARGVLDVVAMALQVDQVEDVGVRPDPGSDVEVEVEGVVTALLPNGHFMLGSVEVDGSGLAPAQVQVGARLEVHGVWKGQVLVARKVEQEDGATHSSAEIEGLIEAFTSVADFVVRGQRCDASAARIEGGRVEDLKVGLKVHVKGSVDGDVLKVTSLEIGR